MAFTGMSAANAFIALLVEPSPMVVEAHANNLVREASGVYLEKWNGGEYAPVDRSQIDVQVLNLPSPGAIANEAFGANPRRPAALQLRIAERRRIKTATISEEQKERLIGLSEQWIVAGDRDLAKSEAGRSVEPDAIDFRTRSTAESSEVVQTSRDA